MTNQKNENVKPPVILCDWCDQEAKWVVPTSAIKWRRDYMCDHHYNSHARSPLAKGKPITQKETKPCAD